MEVRAASRISVNDPCHLEHIGSFPMIERLLETTRGGDVPLTKPPQRDPAEIPTIPVGFL